ncbi:glycosyltransferase family 2 protein [Tamlana crocina]
MALMASIIIPVYNREALIGKTLKSVEKQNYRHWECIIVDDGSVDDTIEIVKLFIAKDDKFKLYERPAESIKGASTCRNIGLQKSKGDYIIFLDSDDTLTPRCLENRISKISEYAKEDFLVFPMGVSRNEEVYKKEIPLKSNYLLEFLNYKLSWSIMCPIWKRKFILNLKGFKEGYPRLNDPELMIRALLAPEVSFKIFYDEPYDTVYYPNITDWTKIKEKYFETLKLFIPDICRELELSNNSKLKSNLVSYLKVWYRDFYFPSDQNLLDENIKLIKIFYNNGIISLLKTAFLFFMYFLYVGFSYLKRELVKRIIKLLEHKN